MTDKSKEKSKKLPALMFYPGDWKRDVAVQSLEPVEKLVWFEMLLVMHDCEERGVLAINGVPMSKTEIAFATNLPAGIVEKALQTLEQKAVFSRTKTGAIYCRRMTRQEDLSEIRGVAGAKGGKQKASKRLAKGLAKPKQNTEDEIENENEIEDETKTEKQEGRGMKTKPRLPLPPLPAELDAAAWESWLKHRRTIRKPITPLTAEKIFADYVLHPGDFKIDIDHSIKMGYQGLFPPGSKNLGPPETNLERNLRILAGGKPKT